MDLPKVTARAATEGYPIDLLSSTRAITISTGDAQSSWKFNSPVTIQSISVLINVVERVFCLGSEAWRRIFTYIIVTNDPRVIMTIRIDWRLNKAVLIYLVQ